MAKRLSIRDLTLRDGQQSQFATRMTQEQVERVLPYFRKAKFYAMEVWGGAVPDSVMRYLNESPWFRLESIKAGIGDTSKLTALSRGRNLFGYMPYPDDVIRGFCVNAVKSGIDIMRIFDALNDTTNMECSIKSVKEAGGLADCAICYTTDPKFAFGQKLKSAFTGKKIPSAIFTTKYFVTKAKELAALGADMISIKDMAGLIEPARAFELVKALKQEVGLPVDLHTHCTPGFGVASCLMAITAGADIIDTVIMDFSGGPAAPAYEIIDLFAKRLDFDTGVDNASVGAINRELRKIRAELAAFDQYKLLPPIVDLTTWKPEPDIARLFDDATEAAVAGKTDKVLDLCQKIEAFFNYPEPDHIVKTAQIPGGMYTNMMAQLKEAKLEHHLHEVLAAVPKVRLDCGVPPLVTPTSQIVGIQAVNCVVDKALGKPFYSNVSKNFVDLVKGTYGKTPWPVNPDFREKIAGVREETPYDVSKHKRPANPELPDCGGALLAEDEKEMLLLELFPSVAEKYLKGVRDAEWKAELASRPPEPEPDEGPYPPAFWENLNLAMGS